MNSGFADVHEALEKWIGADIIPCAASIVLEGKQIVDEFYGGHQNREDEISLRADSIFRLFSNTKLVTAVAAMTLWEQGKFDLDDELSKHIPEFSSLRVLRPGATSVDETTELAHPPTIRQLMCHTAGFSYGIFMESVVDSVYVQSGVLNPQQNLAGTVDVLSRLPLAYQPGERFQYSVSSDVLARLIELWTGSSFGEYLSQTIFNPLDMQDTGFFVPETNHDRFCSMYAAADPEDPMKSGLSLSPELLGSYREPPTLESGGGGLVGTLPDYAKFIQMIMGEGLSNGVRILQPDTLKLMRTNQLPDGVSVQLPNWLMPNTLFGLGFALKQHPAEGEPDGAIDEYHWGGLAGTHSWMSPRLGIGGIVFTQRMPGFWHPFSWEFKRLVYQKFA